MRARSSKRVGDALAHKRLTLISAPAGFGKTAALTRQLQQLPNGTAVAWASADEDDELHRTLACLVAALEPLDLPWRAAPDALIAGAGGTRDARRAVATELLNALAACEVPRGLIVLDDAHRIEDRAVRRLDIVAADHKEPITRAVPGAGDRSGQHGAAGPVDADAGRAARQF